MKVTTFEPSAEELARRLTLLSLAGNATIWPTMDPVFMQQCAAKLLEQARELDARERAIRYTLRQATMGHKSMSKLREAVKL